MVDALLLGDRTFSELADAAGLPGNAATHHLAVLESVGLVERRVSEGDRRRRYISARAERLRGLLQIPSLTPNVVVFVCTHNSARSQFAAALWRQRTGNVAESAGSHPAERVHPLAVRAGRDFGVDLAGASPQGYDAIAQAPDLVVSVCDRAHESGVPIEARSVHWSVPDPVRAGTPAAFHAAFADIAGRIERLTADPQP